MKNTNNNPNEDETMRTYLQNLITEKGRAIDDDLDIDGHIGLTYEMLIDFIMDCPEQHRVIRTTLVKIDYCNGDVFHYLRHLANGMLAACGY